LVLLVMIASVVLYKEVGVLCICLGYIFFGLFRHVRRSKAKVTADAAEEEDE
jgi:hypothetical protein